MYESQDGAPPVQDNIVWEREDKVEIAKRDITIYPVSEGCRSRFYYRDVDCFDTTGMARSSPIYTARLLTPGEQYYNLCAAEIDERKPPGEVDTRKTHYVMDRIPAYGHQYLTTYAIEDQRTEVAHMLLDGFRIYRISEGDGQQMSIHHFNRYICRYNEQGEPWFYIIRKVFATVVIKSQQELYKMSYDVWTSQYCLINCIDLNRELSPPRITHYIPPSNPPSDDESSDSSDSDEDGDDDDNDEEVQYIGSKRVLETQSDRSVRQSTSTDVKSSEGTEPVDRPDHENFDAPDAYLNTNLKESNSENSESLFIIHKRSRIADPEILEQELETVDNSGSNSFLGDQKRGVS
jgi:hypothetical protein